MIHLNCTLATKDLIPIYLRNIILLLYYYYYDIIQQQQFAQSAQTVDSVDYYIIIDIIINGIKIKTPECLKKRN